MTKPDINREQRNLSHDMLQSSSVVGVWLCRKVVGQQDNSIQTVIAKDENK
jgi:hypothetical protein